MTYILISSSESSNCNDDLFLYYVRKADLAYSRKDHSGAIHFITRAKDQPGVTDEQRVKCLLNLLHLYGITLSLTSIEDPQIAELRHDVNMFCARVPRYWSANDKILGDINLKLADTYKNTCHYQALLTKAKEWYHSALSVSKSNGNDFMMDRIQTGLGVCYLKGGNIDLGREYFNLALQRAKQESGITGLEYKYVLRIAQENGYNPELHHHSASTSTGSYHSHHVALSGCFLGYQPTWFKQFPTVTTGQTFPNQQFSAVSFYHI